MLTRRRATSRGFTLTEVIVTLGVISLILALALPALSTVRHSGRRTESLSNLRQMAMAAHQYMVFFEAWPTAVRYENDGVFTTIAWDWEQNTQGDVRPGPLWQFTNDPSRVLQCPEFFGSSTFGADPFTGYNYNTSYLGGEAAFPATGWDVVRRGVPPSGCRRMSTTVIFGAGGWRGGANKFMRAPGNREGHAMATIYGGGQAFRYLAGSTVVAYLDGHVGVIDRAYPGGLATDELLEGAMGWPANGFLGDDDRLYDPR